MIGDLPKTIVDNDDGKPVLPDERFANASEVRSTCINMIGADRKRVAMRERVDGLVNGFPSYPKSVTASKGFGWFPRVNYREAEGLIQAQQTPLFDLVTEVDHCIDIELDIKASSTEELEDWQNSIEKNWTWLLFKRWRKSFNYHLPLSQREMLVHGMGAHVWPDNKKWVPRTPRSGQILFPEACPLDFETDGEYFMLRDFVPSVNVYSFIRNEKAATARGWLVDNVWTTLAKAQKQNQPVRQTAQIEELQRKARRGDIGYWNTSETGLWINWMFVREFESGISLYAIEENISAGNKDGGYLFKMRFMFEEWNDVLVLFPYDVGNGDIHSVRGLGWRTKDFFELSNRVTNSMVAQVLISAFPQMKQTQPSVDPEKMRLMRMGALNITPYGLEPSLIQFPPLANSGLALQKYLRDTLSTNNQSFTGNTPEPKDRETALSFGMRAQDSAKVSNGMQSLYESNYQQWQEKMYRGCINTPSGDLPYQKMAQEFRQRCLDDGVPKEALTERAIGQIREVTATGAGSAAIRLQALNMLVNSPVYMNAPEDKKIMIERSLVATTLGQANVDKFARSIHDADLPDPDTSFAMQESNGLAEGGQALIGVGQNDLEHATNHLQVAMQHAQACEQGQEDPQKCLMALQGLLNHAGQHLARMQNNPYRKQAFDQLEAQWKQLAQYAQKLQNEIQSQQGQPSPQQQQSEDFQLGMAKLQGDQQIKQQKTQADLALKFRKEAFNERLADAKTSAGILRDRSKVAHGMNIENARTAHDILLNNAKTTNDIATNNAKTQATIQQSKVNNNGAE